jgi:hypothetical protein
MVMLEVESNSPREVKVVNVGACCVENCCYRPDPSVDFPRTISPHGKTLIPMNVKAGVGPFEAEVDVYLEIDGKLVTLKPMLLGEGQP